MLLLSHAPCFSGIGTRLLVKESGMTSLDSRPGFSKTKACAHIQKIKKSTHFNISTHVNFLSFPKLYFMMHYFLILNFTLDEE